MCPGRFRRGPIVQCVLRLEHGGELKLTLDDFVDRAGLGQRQRGSQAVVQEPEFPMFPLEIGLQGLHKDLRRCRPCATLERRLGSTPWVYSAELVPANAIWAIHLHRYNDAWC